MMILNGNEYFLLRKHCTLERTPPKPYSTSWRIEKPKTKKVDDACCSIYVRQNTLHWHRYSQHLVNEVDDDNDDDNNDDGVYNDNVVIVVVQ
uniref:Uncharacterized protein n=1 Tax=Glossina palpalis gambiensis TaxID=67801 RepID=A0A1B0AWB5_9MUSC